MFSRDAVIAFVGEYFFRKYRTRAQDSGVYAAAKQLRKQGVPLEVTRVILLWRH